MKKILIVILSIIIISCKPAAPNQEFAEEKITYFADERTGLCFAMIASYTHNAQYVYSITEVPCDKVDKFIIK